MPKDMGDDFGSDFDAGSSEKKQFGGVSFKWENLLPIIVIIIVILLIVFKTNILAGAGLFSTSQGARILVLGAPSQETRQILNDQENKDLIKEARILTLASIEHNPAERVKGYDIIILDQSLISDKSISRRTADAITDYVKKGGKLIVVLNSGIERPNDVSVLGWQANFGDIIPVSCDMINSVPSCKSPKDLQGTLYASLESHPIMKGITQVPAIETSGPIRTTTFEVAVDGKEIAYLEDDRTNKYYTGIVEKSLLMGKVIYFNFNPGISKAIFINTIEYLK